MQLTENTEAPYIYRKWVAISVLGAALRRKCYLNWGNVGNLYPNMYIVLVGPSGARKTTAMRLGEFFINKTGIFTSSEAITKEALVLELEASLDEDTLQSSVTVFSEELTVFLGYDNSEMMSYLCSWYDCKDLWKYKTKNRGENEILGVWVNILGATTPSSLRKNLPMDAIGGGLASRIIFVYAKRKARPIAFPFDDPKKEKLREKLLSDYFLIAGLKGSFKFTDTFAAGYKIWYEAQEEDDPFMFDKNFDGYSSRRPGHLLKLCMILSASRDQKMLIDGEILKRAIATLEEVEKDMKKVFSGIGLSDTSDLQFQILNYIESKGRVYKKDLFNAFHMDLAGPQQLDAFLDMYKAAGIIQGKTDGSGRTAYLFNRKTVG